MLFYGGTPRDHNPLLWTFYHEVRNASTHLLQDARFQYLAHMFADRPNPEVSRFSYALFALEDESVQLLQQAVAAASPRSEVMAWMFDGFILQIAREDWATLDNTLQAFRDAHGIEAVYVPFSEAGGSKPDGPNQRCLMSAMSFFGVEETLVGAGPFAFTAATPLMAESGMGLSRLTSWDSLRDGDYLIHSKFHFYAARISGAQVVLFDDGAEMSMESVAFMMSLAETPCTIFRVVPATMSEKHLPPLAGGGKKKSFETPRKVCDCGGRLYHHRTISAVLYDMGGVEDIEHKSLRCNKKACRTVYNYNFKVSYGNYINTVMIDDIEAVFINDKVAFSKRYLAYHESLHFRGFLTMRATEFAGRDTLFEADSMHSSRRWRELYSNTRFLYLAMKELQDPDEKPENFVLGRELSEKRLLAYDRRVHLYDFVLEGADTVKEVVIDGHAKVLTKICGPPPARGGRPRKNGTSKPFSNGWFMALHPGSGKILGVKSMASPENNDIAIATLRSVVRNYASLNCVIYDRACGLQPRIEREGLFPQVKHYCVDAFHAKRHKRTCRCNPEYVTRLKRRIQGVNTQVAEQTFAWFRGYARPLNDLGPLRNRFMMLYYAKQYNKAKDDNSQPMPPARGVKRAASQPYPCQPPARKRPAAAARL